MKNRYYTLMVVPSSTSRVKTLKVSARIIHAIMTVVGIAVISSSYLLYDYLAMKGQVGELERLRVEARAQRLKINTFAQQIIDVEKEMARLRKFDAMLRVVFETDRGKGTASARKVGGMGGSGDLELAEYPEILEGKITELNDQIEKDLTHLKGETTAQEASLSQLVQFLQEKRSLMLATPSIWPVRGLVTSAYEKRIDPFSGKPERHRGLDIATIQGTPIVAPADGIVAEVGRTVGFGKIIGIDHGYGYGTTYAHVARVAVKAGQRVNRGDVIAYVGSTGRSTGPHLHYEVHKNGISVDPSEYILN